MLTSREGSTRDGRHWSEQNAYPYFCSGSPSRSSTFVHVSIAFRGALLPTQLNELEYHEHEEELERLRARYWMAKYSP